ncbi:MAG: winged helix-turn-helix transcriptional regulator, partial [Bulleidia sp.]
RYPDAAEGYAMYQKKLEEDIRCPLEYGLELFGGKWKSRIICVLNETGKLRYSELRKQMTNITDAVLASSLKELIHDDLIIRKSYDEIPPRVEYSLSRKGKSVVPILQNICRWSGIFYRDDPDHLLSQCQRCDHRGK